MTLFSLPEANRPGLNEVLDGLFAFVGIFSLDGIILEVNKAPLAAAGLRREDVVGTPFADAYWVSHSAEEQNKVRDAIERAAQGETVREEFQVRVADDRIVAMDSTIAPLRDADGRVVAVIGSGVDVSDRTKILEELRTERDFAKSLVEMAPVIILLLDMDGRIEHVNPFFEQLTGYSFEQVKHKDWFSTFLPERDRKEAQKNFRLATRKVREKSAVHPLVTRDGREIDIEWRERIIRDEDGRPASMLWVGQDSTERRMAQKVIAKSENQLSEAQRIAQIGSWNLDIASGTLYWSEEIYRIFELDPARFTPSYEKFIDTIHPDDRALVNEAYSRSLEERSDYDIVHRLRMEDGRVKYVHEHCETIFLDDGTPLTSSGTVQDITERRVSEIARDQAESRSGELVEELKLTVAVMEHRDRDLVLLNQMLESLMSCHHSVDALDIVLDHARQIFDGQAGAVFVNAPEATAGIERIRWWGETRDEEGLLTAVQSCVNKMARSGQTLPGEDMRTYKQCTVCNQGDFTCVPLVNEGRVFGSLMLRQSGDGRRQQPNGRKEMLIAVADSVSLALSNVEMRDRLYAESTRDPLTQLYNRRYFQKAVDDATERSTRDGMTFAVHVLDLDGFKSVNDRFGHPAGDSLIEIIAKRLKATVRRDDTVARLGGDEFAILQRLGKNGRESAAVLAQRILECIRQPYFLVGQQANVGVSIGIAMSPEDGCDADQLLRNADLALYKVKSDGRNGFRFFEAAMDEEVRTRHSLEAGLRAELARDGLEILYNPAFEASSRELVCLEARAHWQHPDLGLLASEKFVPIAEETGLVIALGEWVMETACRQAASWPAHVNLAVNLSPVQFRSADIVDLVRSVLASTGLDPKRLELEVRRFDQLQSYNPDLDLLRDLADLGVAIVLDDFGAGRSSLSYLKNFDFDKIKIDEILVSEISTDADSAAIMCAVAGLGRTMRFDTAAGGVETEEQVTLLWMAGCSRLQGKLFGGMRAHRELDFGAPNFGIGAPGQGSKTGEQGESVSPDPKRSSVSLGSSDR